MNLFGDYPLDAGGRIATWGSTANFLQMLGYYHRDCLFVVDDFKPEMIRHGEVVRLLQNAGDGTARGRLRHDARTRASRPVRGLLLATAEDLPMHNASGRARSIVVQVANREKDLELGRKCVAMSPLYRGFMADFLAWVIREGRGAVFAERVEHWQAPVLRVGRGHAERRPDRGQARPAGGGVRADGRLPGRRLARGAGGGRGVRHGGRGGDGGGERGGGRGRPGQQRCSWRRCGPCCTGAGCGSSRRAASAGEKNRGAVVGRIVAGGSSDGGQVVELSVAMGLQSVQRSLRQQGKPPLQVSEKTLISQIEAEGLLLDRDNRPVVPGRGGNHSRQVRIERRRVRVIRMRLADLVGPEDDVRQRGATAGGFLSTMVAGACHRGRWGSLAAHPAGSDLTRARSGRGAGT